MVVVGPEYSRQWSSFIIFSDKISALNLIIVASISRWDARLSLLRTWLAVRTVSIRFAGGGGRGKLFFPPRLLLLEVAYYALLAEGQRGTCVQTFKY